MEDVLFIVDCMLGRLAKWLRILGFNVQYVRTIHDDDLIRSGTGPGRILLTRDTGLTERSDVGPFLFIRSDFVQEQLSQVIESLHLTLNFNKFLTRCVSCNGLLESIPYEQARGRIPDFIIMSCRVFSRCTQCGKLYWAGSHQREMLNMIKKLGLC